MTPPATTTNTGAKVCIVGAGIGGVALAARLASQGFNVSVYEKNPYAGGRCSLIEQDGFRFDQGPSLYLMPKIFESTFADVGENLKDHLRLARCDPNYRLYFHDGQVLDLGSDLVKVRASLERFERDSFQGFLAFQTLSQPHYDLSIHNVLSRNFTKFTQLLSVANLKMLPFVHLHVSLYTWVSRFFKSDLLRQAFSFQSMYMGMSPFDAPATYSLLQYTEFTEGIWYPLGGFHTVVSALERIAVKHGAQFHYNCAISEIQTTSDRATSLVLEDKSVVESDIVVCNADLVYAYKNLLPRTKYSDRLGKLKHTSSSFSFYWGLNRQVPELHVHNVFLPDQYKESFDDIFKRGTLPTQPSFYIHVPSRIDATASPPGKDALSILVPTGTLVTDATTAEELEVMCAQARTAVLKTLESRLGIMEFQSLIEIEVVNTPKNWMDKYNLYQGSILGLSHCIPQVMYFRPATRHGVFGNLFFVGASTHPGTGVPVVLKGAQLVADQVVQYVQGAKRGSHKAWRNVGPSPFLGWAVLVAVFAVIVVLTSYMQPGLLGVHEDNWVTESNGVAL